MALVAKIFQNLKVPIDEELSTHLAWLLPQGFGDVRVLKQSLDARKRHQAHFVYSVEVAEPGETLKIPSFDLAKVPAKALRGVNKPVVVGSGPAGLFAALRLVERGVPCRLFERGSPSETRIKGINLFWRYGKLDPRNNVCFGEGGAGLYSDGKLITRIKSPHIPYVMNRLVKFGAPSEIEYLSNPHVGSDKIRRVIPKMRQFLIESGCEIYFDTRVTELLSRAPGKIDGIKTEYGDIFESDHVILATGHSAEDILQHLRDLGVKLEGKSFAMGLRVEHPQKLINQIQYRDYADHPKLGSANYKLTSHDHQSGLGVYSFCMCPGGYVLSSGTEERRVVVNGMSNYARNSPFANSAIVITINHSQLFKDDLWGGMKMREQLEAAAYEKSLESGGTGRELPTQNLLHFLDGKTRSLRKGSSPSGETPVDLSKILPGWMSDHLRQSLAEFDKSMRGFLNAEAQLYGVESRTSCPLRVTRDPESLQSLSHQGLYPAGEGAGYAGGITSAACDGVKIADQIAAGLHHSFERVDFEHNST